MAIRLHVWGDYALFTRPEFKAERLSYDVMTPSAARGILDAIYWHPGVIWCIDRIYVRAPIQFTTIRKNEISSTISASNIMTAVNRDDPNLYMSASADIMQRASTLLKNVDYYIDAHCEMSDPPTANPSRSFMEEGDAQRGSYQFNDGKIYGITQRRIDKGQFFHHPYFGCREYPVNFAPAEEIPMCPPDLVGTFDLGYMLFDMNFNNPENIRPMFFRAIMKDGVIEVPHRSSREVRG